MTLDDFWALIERSAMISTDKDDRAEWLAARLAGRPLDEIIEFEIHLTAQRRRVDTWLMWDAANHVMDDHCSADSFFYFQPWLVGLGRTAFDQVATEPDALAELPEVRELAGRPLSDWADDEWPEWESLNYVAAEAYERVTGEENGLDDALEARGLDRVCDPDPGGDRVDFADRGAARFPRLAALMG